MTETQENILLRKYFIKEINQEIFPELKMPFQIERETSNSVDENRPTPKDAIIKFQNNTEKTL